MKALTLWRPWDAAILKWPGRHRKLLENRTWRPPADMIGRFFAIHAGQRYDRVAAQDLSILAAEAVETNGGWRVPRESESPMGIVGVVRLAGVIAPDPKTGRPELVAGTSPGFCWEEWWTGEIGWLLAEPIAITPVPCKGAQGLWTVPVDVAATVRDRVRSARAA